MNKGYYLGQMRYYSRLIRLNNTKKNDYKSLSNQLSSYSNNLDTMKNNLIKGKDLLLNGGFSIEGVSFSGEKIDESCETLNNSSELVMSLQTKINTKISELEDEIKQYQRNYNYAAYMYQTDTIEIRSE